MVFCVTGCPVYFLNEIFSYKVFNLGIQSIYLLLAFFFFSFLPFFFFLLSSPCFQRKQGKEQDSFPVDFSVLLLFSLMKDGQPRRPCLSVITHEMKNYPVEVHTYFAQTLIQNFNICISQFLCMCVLKLIMLTLYFGKIIFHFLIILFFLFSLQY